jgi:hypothetical protein
MLPPENTPGLTDIPDLGAIFLGSGSCHRLQRIAEGADVAGGDRRIQTVHDHKGIGAGCGPEPVRFDAPAPNRSVHTLVVHRSQRDAPLPDPVFNQRILQGHHEDQIDQKRGRHDQDENGPGNFGSHIESNHGTEEKYKIFFKYKLFLNQTAIKTQEILKYSANTCGGRNFSLSPLSDIVASHKIVSRFYRIKKGPNQSRFGPF